MRDMGSRSGPWSDRSWTEPRPARWALRSQSSLAGPIQRPCSHTQDSEEALRVSMIEFPYILHG